MDIVRRVWDVLLNPDEVGEIREEKEREISTSSSTSSSEGDSSYDGDTSSSSEEDDNNNGEKEISPTDRLCIISQRIRDDSYFNGVRNMDKYMNLMLTYFNKFTKYSPITTVRK